MTFKSYDTDLKTKHAIERIFEIIGEAVSRISETYMNAHPNIEWWILKDFRNFITHDYFDINNQIVWIPLPINYQTYY